MSEMRGLPLTRELQNPFPHFYGFTYSTAISTEKGVTHRDPSPVIRVEAAVT